ncbi:MAG: nucleotidyltransferase family protein [bacterium]
MKNKKNTIIEYLKKRKIKNFCHRHQIKALSLFGSQARADFKKTSDIDLLIRFGEIKSMLELIHIEFELSKLMGKKVDIVTKGSIPAYLRKEIRKESVAII